VTTFDIEPNGPFSLAPAQDFARGFTAGIGGGGVEGTSIVMAFPIEGRNVSAAVVLHQDASGRVVGASDAEADVLPDVIRQASRSLSLDHDGSGWPGVGERDAVIGRAQETYRYMRPVCFYSAYEAATSFLIGQRIAMRQSARIKERLRESAGDRPTVEGRAHPAFPRPEQLLELKEIAGVSAQKVTWLHGIAEAALQGRLDTQALRAMPREEALATLRSIPGIGPWTAEAIRLRGCGMADELPENEEASLRAAAALYDRPSIDREAFNGLAEAWRPYRMWAVVLLRVAWNRSSPGGSYRT
jgi:DNA-3-methyladenine glycosylase II